MYTVKEYSDNGVLLLHTAYFDNSATTEPDEKVIKKVTDVMKNNFANPSSLHRLGTNAYLEVEEAREKLASRLDCDKTEIIFTSGGTEANNIAILGTAKALKKRGTRVVTTAVEHPSVLKTYDSLSDSGFEVIKLHPNVDGTFDNDELEAAIDENTILVSSMLVNNETGTVLNVGQIRNCLDRKKSRAVFHVDGVQAFGKMPTSMPDIGCDLFTVSGHKIHGPKGIGALYRKKRTRLLPITYGGLQEGEIRSGTIPTELIAGFGVACDEINYNAITELSENLSRIILDKLDELHVDYTVNSPSNRLPVILNISFNGLKSETMLHHLSAAGVSVSSGSACSKGKKSEVLQSFGVSPELTDSAIRISFCRYNRPEDALLLAETAADGFNNLARKTV